MGSRVDVFFVSKGKVELRYSHGGATSIWDSLDQIDPGMWGRSGDSPMADCWNEASVIFFLDDKRVVWQSNHSETLNGFATPTKLAAGWAATEVGCFCQIFFELKSRGLWPWEMPDPDVCGGSLFHSAERSSYPPGDDGPPPPMPVRRNMLRLSTSEVMLPGEQRTVVRHLDSAGRVDRLIVPTQIAPLFVVERLQVGMMQQLTGAIPAMAFSELAFGGPSLVVSFQSNTAVSLTVRMVERTSVVPAWWSRLRWITWVVPRRLRDWAFSRVPKPARFTAVLMLTVVEPSEGGV